jgi:ferrochelatase
MSVGDYERRVRAAAEEVGWEGEFEMVRQWHLESGYIQLLARYCKDALGHLSPGALDKTTLVFTAHSLPAAIVRAGDPYPDQLTATGKAVAESLGYERWRIGWQSAGRSEAEWLGPDVLDVLDELAAAGERGAVVCPCGFVADHLEVLYDLDIEAAARARELGLEFARTRSPNDDPDFLDTLAGVVARAIDTA